MGGVLWSKPQDGPQVPPKPKGMNLDDHFGLKRHLDEVAMDIVISRGYEENHTLSNIKIFIGFLACAVAIVGQSYPQKFPDDRNYMLGTIFGYVGLNVLLWLITYFKEKNTFLVTNPLLGSFTQTGLAVSSRIGRYTDVYTLRIESSDPSSAAAHAPVELTKSITKWYTSEGILAEDIFLEDVQKLIEQYEDDSRKTK